ncbi:MAG: hypothetical protein NTU74_01625 [Deltaproteobacteria bacterium]|nr:hypothetical protein [Deltaproteobacteria bacterium]
MELTVSTYELVKALDDFSYTLSASDHVWNILCPGEANRWNHLYVNKYLDTFFIAHVNGGCGSLEVKPEDGVCTLPGAGAASYSAQSRSQSVAVWGPFTRSAYKWLKIVRRDWIKANKRVQKEYPLRYRYGMVPHAIIRASQPNIYRLDSELGMEKTLEFVHLVEDGFFLKEENTEASTMTADDYFKYCRIAYIAGKRDDESVDASLSGREMYGRYADGRHEGLLEIDPDSGQEFADWIDGVHPKRTIGGHPWEFKRGSNTTHINLSVSRPSPYRKEGFKVELRAESTGRMAEALRMFLAIRKAGLPISIAHPEAVRKRLLAQDNIGIVPSYASLHRANQHFRLTDDVFDVIYYDDLGRFKRRATPFITWEPLPILKPGDA